MRSHSIRLVVGHRLAAPLGLALALLACAPTGGRAAGPDECASAQPAWVFCSGFEEGNLNLWDDYDGNPPSTNTLLADPGPAGLAGNHVMQLHVPPGRGGADLVKALPQGYDRLYARWYVKWEPGYDFSAENHGSGLHAGSRDLLGRSDNRPSGSDWFSAFVEPQIANRRPAAYAYYRGMYQDCANPVGSCWGDMFPCMVDDGQGYCTKPQHRETELPPQLEAGRWYCLEMMLDGGTPTATAAGANGSLDFWIDGVEIGPWTDLWLRTTANLKLDVLWLNLFHHAEHSVAGMLIDNVVLSTARIGPIVLPTSVEESPALREYALRTNAPNPFNPLTTIRFDLPSAGHVRLAIYDVSGRLVRALIDGEYPAGTHSVTWDGRDAAGRAQPSGSYLTRMEAGGQTQFGRMSLVR